MKLIFATNNQHKVAELKSVVGNRFEICSLLESGIDLDIPEPHDTLNENALEKSKTIFQLTGNNCFSEDTGLEVDALNGEPGVKSARYAGEEKSFENNIDKLLLNLKNSSKRSARFRTIISLIINKEEHFFEGICEGRIHTERKGTEGFGYDSVFIPTGSEKSFGEMNMEEKKKFSHRRKATDQLIKFLQQLPTFQD